MSLQGAGKPSFMTLGGKEKCIIFELLGFRPSYSCFEDSHAQTASSRRRIVWVVL